MMIKKILIAMILITVLFTGCTTEENFSQKIFTLIQDDADRKVVLENKPKRIAVTSASFLEPLHLFDCQIVGRPDSKNQMPTWAENIASIGQVYQINLEELIACNPDLVILNKGMNEKLLSVLSENKIPALVIEFKTYDDVKRGLKIFARIAGDEQLSEKFIQQMDKEINSIINTIPKESLRVAILHSTAQGLSVQTEKSIAGSIAKMLGWENVASNMTTAVKNSDTIPYSLETLAEQNPDVIFVTSMGNINEIETNMREDIRMNDAWQTINAIKSDQMYFLPQELFLLSPGVNYPEAVRKMASTIYPDFFIK